MRLEPATADMVRHVALSMRPRDLLEFQAVLPVDGREAIADILAGRYGGRDDVFCGFSGAAPVAIGGMIELRPNVLALLFFATGKFGKIAAPATRFIQGRLLPDVIAAGAHRIECITLAGYDFSRRWLQLFGLTLEAVCHGYGKRGETFDLYSWVSGDLRAPSR